MSQNNLKGLHSKSNILNIKNIKELNTTKRNVALLSWNKSNKKEATCLLEPSSVQGTIGKILYYILSNIYNLYQITQNYFLPLFNPKYWLSLKHGGS